MHPIDTNTLYQKLNEGMLEERLRAFHINLQKNLPYIKQYGGLASVVESLRGKNICILGAGPSMERAVDVLQTYQHRREIAFIAVDMALLPLVCRGIHPEYVMTCETTPVDYFGGMDTSRMRLIAFSCASSVNIRRWQGAMSFYNWMVSGSPYDALWEKAGRELGSIATGNIITTQAVSLALGCGAQSIYIVGNDLAFHHRYYTKGTAWHRLQRNSVHRFGSFETCEFAAIRRQRDYELRRGERLYHTSHQFLAAKTWLEELLAKQRSAVFDASDPGISGKYAVKIEPKEYFSRFDRRARGRRK
jgi:hypothetical protein